jgi:predicted amidohydrolase
MKISVAQTKPIKGDILANIETHKKLIELAVSHHADAIFFPELSITGYHSLLAKDLATSQDDKRFHDFQQMSNTHKITIGIGVPSKSDLGVLISMFIFQPQKPIETYSKQQLHSDEFPYFVCGNNQTILTINNVKMAPAICYESLQLTHYENANKLGAAIYIASVAKSQNGFDKAQLHYPEIAHKYNLTVLMANCIGYCDDFESVGKSSVWTNKGKLAGQLDNKAEGILIFDTETEQIIEKTI